MRCPDGMKAATATAKNEDGTMIYELSEEHFNTMTLDELRGLYAEARRQAGLARPHTQGYARAIAAVGRIAEAIAAREALMRVLIPRPRRVAAPRPGF